MRTSAKLLSQLTEEELETIYRQFITVPGREQEVRTKTVQSCIASSSREEFLEQLAEHINKQFPKTSPVLWVISIVTFFIALLTSLTQ